MERQKLLRQCTDRAIPGGMHAGCMARNVAWGKGETGLAPRFEGRIEGGLEGVAFAIDDEVGDDAAQADEVDARVE